MAQVKYNKHKTT